MSHEIPSSMQAELGAWNDGKGIDLDTWIGYEGNFSLAVGYTTLFWPSFIELGDYIFFEGVQESNVRQFEQALGSTPQSVEWVLNHRHLSDFHGYDKDMSADKIIALGNVLKEIYKAKLKFQFPDKPCVVEFYQPEDKELLDEYQLSFWQKKHEPKAS